MQDSDGSGTRKGQDLDEQAMRVKLAFGALCRAGGLGPERAEDLRKLDAVMSHCVNVASGRATDADWGRVRRMHSALRERPETRRVRMMELVAGARTDHSDDAIQNLVASLSWWVDERFGELCNDAGEVTEESREHVRMLVEKYAAPRASVELCKLVNALEVSALGDPEGAFRAAAKAIVKP